MSAVFKAMSCKRKVRGTGRTVVLVFLLVALVGRAASGQAGQSGQASGAPVEQGAASQAAGAAAVPASSGKAKKGAYMGPTESVVLPAAPMLDEEGRQRLDPDGKPMFYPPVKQQRDKKGHPRFDPDGKPVMQTATELGYDEKGKKIKGKKEKPPKMTPVSIRRGTFTVDGVMGKAALNYDILDLKYLYLYVPGLGVAVVSNTPFEGAKEQKDAFNGKSLIVTVGGHSLEVASDVPLLGKKKKPAAAFVRLDREFMLPSQYPVVGYGALLARPYGWPGSKANAALTGPVQPPPLPANLRPVQLLAPCPAGQMRKAATARLPGELVTDAPCAPIAAGPK
jgi:hypothetical protein